MDWDDSKFKRGIASTQSAAAKAGKTMGSMLGTLGIGIGVGVAARSLKGIGDHFDNVGKQARRVGIGFEEFQKQAHAFQMADIDMNTYVETVQKITRNLEEAIGGQKEMSESFRILGIDMAKFKELAPDERILAMADAYASANDQQEAFAAMFKIMGRSAGKFRDAFASGSDAINTAGDSLKNIPTEEVGLKIEELNDKWTTLMANLKGGTVNVVSGVVEGFQKAAKGIGLTSLMIEEFIKNGPSGVREVADAFRELEAQEAYKRAGIAPEHFLGAGNVSDEEHRAKVEAMKVSEAVGLGRELKRVRKPLGSGFSTPSALDRGIQSSRDDFSGLAGLRNLQRRGRDTVVEVKGQEELIKAVKDSAESTKKALTVRQVR